jgi:hypothetical protein
VTAGVLVELVRPELLQQGSEYATESNLAILQYLEFSINCCVYPEERLAPRDIYLL